MKLLTEILLSIFAIAIVFIIPHSGIIPLPFAYCSLGFNLKHFEIKAVIVGTIAGVFLFAFINYVFFPLLEKIVKLPAADLGGFNKVRHNTPFYIFILAMGWIVGGFYEEIVFHGFIFTRLEKIIPGKKAVIISFWVSNIIFALYHLQLGTEGVINAFIAGVGYHALMLYYKRNIWYAIFCHAVFDTIALTYIYLGYW